MCERMPAPYRGCLIGDFEDGNDATPRLLAPQITLNRHAELSLQVLPRRISFKPQVRAEAGGAWIRSWASSTLSCQRAFVEHSPKMLKCLPANALKDVARLVWASWIELTAAV